MHRLEDRRREMEQRQKFKYGNAQVAVADGKLLITSDGFPVVAEASPAGYKELARTKAPASNVVVVPVLCNGRIYCRSASGENNLVCFEVSGKCRYSSRNSRGLTPNFSLKRRVKYAALL